jgi:uncharacterized protein (TIGR03086 family)
MEPLDLLMRTATEYRSRLTEVPADRWEDTSVCGDWTVRDVADHIVGGNRFAVALLDGASTAEAIGAAQTGSFEGDPIELFDETAAAQLAAFEGDGALERIVHHPAGDMPGAAFIGFRAGDLLLHGWDLARSTGGDETLPSDLAEAIHAVYVPTVDTARAIGIFADTGTQVPDDAPIGQRLLVLTGRA